MPKLHDPGIVSETFTPDNLVISGVKTLSGVILTGQGVLARGTILGRRTDNEKFMIVASANPSGADTGNAILAEEVDTTSGDVTAPVYVMGEFNSDACAVGAGTTVNGEIENLRSKGILLKDAVNAA